MLWNQGKPQCIIKTLPTRLKKQSSTTMTKRFVQQNFNPDRKHRGESMPSSPKSVFDRLAIDKNKKGRVQSPHERALEKIKGEYKSVVRLKPPLDHGVRGLTDRMMCEIMTKWPTKKLEKIVAFHEYIRPKGEKGIVFRVLFTNTINTENLLMPEAIPGKNVTEVQKKIYICKKALIELNELLKKYARVEIVRMKAEFLATDKEIWVHNAWSIKYKELYNRIDFKDLILQAVMRTALRLEMEKRLQDKDDNQYTKIVHIDTMKESIENHIKNLRMKSGVVDALKPEKCDTRSEEVYKILRPNSAKCLSDIVDPPIKHICKKQGGFAKSVLKNNRPKSAISYRNRALDSAKKQNKIVVTRDEYASIVSDGLRVLHHVLPEKPKDYAEWKKSMEKFQNAVTPNILRHRNSNSILNREDSSTIRTIMRTPSTRPQSARRSSIGIQEAVFLIRNLKK